MIQVFDLVQPQTMPEERFFMHLIRARRLALQIEGVYDLALYQTERARLWQCSLDVEDARTWEVLEADPRLREVVEELKQLGVKIARRTKWERRI